MDVVEGEFDAGFVCDGWQVKGGVGGPAHGDDEGYGVFE